MITHSFAREQLARVFTNLSIAAVSGGGVSVEGCGRGWKRLRSGGVAVGTGAAGGRSVEEFADISLRLGLFGAPEHFWPTRQIPEQTNQTNRSTAADMGLPRL